ncbi:biotin-dependent carboxyltransferase family protein [Sporomusa acidovorans]|uniref:5-oxoprolinase subunit C n=1 Tax=Sporomusa acidovorans (strain ATCC 49682 / DSM 3132 / Mol) TaxID=1123286 RepID=A0ABZ3J9L8_SPOA4|nr:biotin-dependent carboxyltransferase family protein [Sporomusa acidovorans]OZC16181.1 KipI antagonist [Sporomusa acidovorans DSM 3132]SDE30109.1 biotin-dependent carboxylase uncharacterized domain-containing protein [Sporomusa acidovorans]
MITVIQQGFFTTVQDEGRWGYQAYGLPTAGMMDRQAGRTANLLAGNALQAAVLEMTSMGAAFRFDEEQLVAVAGADMQVKVNGVSVPNWSAFVVPKNGEVRFAAAVTGYRAYMAVRGGVDVPLVLGSRSTCVKAGIGGYQGRTLRQGDVLAVGQAGEEAGRARTLPHEYVPAYGGKVSVRVILGPQQDMFADEAIATFFTKAYTVTKQADRIGYRLTGPRILPVSTADIISDAVYQGAVQIATNGMPFIMMADHQTTGGFAKIGYVLRSDLPKVAQTKTGDSIRFCRVSEAEAIAALKDEQQMFASIAAAVNG